MPLLDTEILLRAEAPGRTHPYCFTEALITERLGVLAANIPKDARVAISMADRLALSDPGNKLWRWVAGGLLLVIRLKDCTIITLQMTASGVPVWSKHFTTSSGFADSPREWANPSLVVREGIEEVYIATPDGFVVIQFGIRELDALAYEAIPTIRYLVSRVDSMFGLFRTSRHNVVRAKLLRLRGQKEIVVSLDGREIGASLIPALPVIDPKTRGIDLMHAAEVDLTKFRLDDIAIFHAEEKDGRAVDGKIWCLELDKSYRPRRVIRSFKTGHVVPIGRYNLSRMTPVLRQTLAALQA